MVSLTGITGARADLPDNLTKFIARLRSKTDMPLVLGFGISTTEHARQVSALTDGFIVGSALGARGRRERRCREGFGGVDAPGYWESIVLPADFVNVSGFATAVDSGL